MTRSDHSNNTSLLLLVAGAKGAVASTLAVALAAMQSDTASVLPSLTTGNLFARLGLLPSTRLAGWDTRDDSLSASIKLHGVVPDTIWQSHTEFLDRMPVFQVPDPATEFSSQVEQLTQDITTFKSQHADARPVFVNLLPAAAPFDLSECRSLSQLFAKADSTILPDLAYTMAAIFSGVPVVNFTPNIVEIPAVLDEAVKQGVPVAGT